ncbi:MAG: multicopper oxidase family protein, partial [Alphaproteobacteria bacterium]|nr:multicopper oxidase family protein [Alphaproteobacteria bacterium]
MRPHRRQFLAGAAALGLALPGAAQSRTLVAAPARQNLAGPGHPDTEVWAYDGQVPGPVLRFRQGQRLALRLDNRLPEPTTIHWHGLRLPIDMDGVPGISQPSVAPGAAFDYAFDLKDAGTYWYHPHANSGAQLGRGLAGALIVDEAVPVSGFSRDVVWLLQDFRLERSGAIRADFGNRHDASHDGRLGNTVTLNGSVVERFAVAPGERIRLRLINAANARIFTLDFEDLPATAIALDGHPVEPHRPQDQVVELGPGQRVDLALDIAMRPGERRAVIDRFRPREAWRLVDLDASLAPVPPP